jgi:hypothetical protein
MYSGSISPVSKAFVSLCTNDYCLLFCRYVFYSQSWQDLCIEQKITAAAAAAVVEHILGSVRQCSLLRNKFP